MQTSVTCTVARSSKLPNLSSQPPLIMRALNIMILYCQLAFIHLILLLYCLATDHPTDLYRLLHRNEIVYSQNLYTSFASLSNLVSVIIHFVTMVIMELIWLLYSQLIQNMAITLLIAIFITI